MPDSTIPDRDRDQPFLPEERKRVCTCVSCGNCAGLGHPEEDLERCDNCDGSGVSELCGYCGDFEDNRRVPTCPVDAAIDAMEKK